MLVHVNRATFGCLIAKLFYHAGIVVVGGGGREGKSGEGAIVLPRAPAAAASRQVENRSSAIYRDCQRAFEQSSVPSASDSFCRIFQKSRKAGRLHARSVAR